MIQQVFKSIKKVFIPRSEFETQTTLLQKKAGTYKVKCTVDDDVVDCQDLSEWEEDAQKYYTGVPAPAYLPEDPWFPSPTLSQKQMTVKEAHEQAVADKQILDESESKESADIHQKLYEIASKNWNTVAETQGGSENFQEGPGPNGWNSGTGMRQFN